MKRAPWFLVVLFALGVWLVPLLVIQAQAEPVKRAPKRPPPKAGDPAPRGPLILYADTWPTREVIDLKEVQGATAETDHALGAKAVASDLALALDELGIVAEAQRLDDLPEDAALLDGRAIVLVYPVRHGQPPAAIQRFIDQRLEALVAEQEPRLQTLTLADVAIAEKPAQAAHAQAALAETMRYYGLAYHPGVALLEPMKSIEIYDHLRAMAKQVAK